MWRELHDHQLRFVALDTLHPTQISVGRVEVRSKRAEWARLSREQRRQELQHHVFPAVIGPKQEFYIVDHHHLGLALHQEGVEKACLAILDNLSWLKRDVFWRTMEFRSWAHPYDATGKRQSYRQIPQHLWELEDDPYRGLAGLVRQAGGFAKSHAPFAEFLWADYFRSRFDIQSTTDAKRKVVRAAVALAQSAEARYLPGWAGREDLSH